MRPGSPTFESAHFLCYRIYDIANEIDLRAAEKLLQTDTRRLKLSRENSQYLLLPNPPVTLHLGQKELVLSSGAVMVEATARIFEHGAGSIIIKVPIPRGTSMEDVIPLADELFDSKAVDALGLQLMNRLRADIQSACEEPHLWEENETYTVLFAERLGEGFDVQEIPNRPELARLLIGERGGTPLSERETAAVTSSRFSYRNDDLAVIDWNSAFVCEPSGSTDIPDLLEICNAQLLEFRYYDAQLDRLLLRIYEDMQKERGRKRSRIWRSPYKAMTRSVLQTLLEMSEFIERVENSLKIIGDFYLAKVYEAAVRRLRIPVWQGSVTRKQQLLSETYELLKGEVDTARALTLETAVVVLIVTEIALAIWRH
ncbi:MAG: hypothetical protein ACJ790_22710 [Myxococcaceae bacterium]